jgi:hypothetical protein
MRTCTELMEVAKDLCALATVWTFLDKSDKALALIEQAAALLVERARHITIDRAQLSQNRKGLQ